jgi:hypothetical protein
MKENLKGALYGSLFILIGFPIIFIVSSLLTDDWRYFIYSLGPTLTAGMTGLMLTLNRLKKKANNI